MKVCPACLRELPQPEGRRICSACNQAIRRHDRWQFGSDGRPKHKDCTNPEGQPETRAQQELIP